MWKRVHIICCHIKYSFSNSNETENIQDNSSAEVGYINVGDGNSDTEYVDDKSEMLVKYLAVLVTKTESHFLF